VIHPTDELTALLDDALPAERAAAVRSHLAACPACRAEQARLRGAVALLAALPPPPEPSPFFATRLEARLRAEADQPRGLLARLAALRWRVLLPVAGAVAAAGLALAVGLRHPRSPDETLFAANLELLEDYDTASAVGVDEPDDVLVVAQLDTLRPRQREGRP
jgi:anti-sigma factor RsiW